MELTKEMKDFNEILMNQRRVHDRTINMRGAEMADYLVQMPDFQRIQGMNILKEEFHFGNAFAYDLIKEALKQAPLPDQIPSIMWNRALELAKEFPKTTIPAIKRLRVEFNVSLKYAKRVIDLTRQKSK